MGGYALAAAREAEAFGGGAAHGDMRVLYAEGVGQVLAHGFPVVPDLGPLTDHDRIHVGYGPRVTDEPAHLAQQLDGVGVPVALVGVGKVVSDVLEPRGPEQGVGDGVGEDIGVGVAEEAFTGGDLYATEDQVALLVRPGEGVGVYPQADPETQPNTP